MIVTEIIGWMEKFEKQELEKSLLAKDYEVRIPNQIVQQMQKRFQALSVEGVNEKSIVGSISLAIS